MAVRGITRRSLLSKKIRETIFHGRGGRVSPQQKINESAVLSVKILETSSVTKDCYIVTACLYVKLYLPRG